MKNQKKSETTPLFIIAEIGTSHNGDLSRVSDLVHASRDAGADCVKTQIVFADEIIHPNTGEVELPGGKIRLYDRFTELEQNFDFYARLKELTEDAGLQFLASPFGFKSLEWLIKLGCKAIKIASPELNHFPLLERAAAAGKKILLSTGVSRLSDIEAALDCTGTENAALFHCITSYPAPEEEYNLNVIPALSKQFGMEAGVSDHSIDPILVPAVAAAVGARYIEKHITLGNSDGGLDDPIALIPANFALMTAAVRKTEKILAEGGSQTSEGPQQALQALRRQFGGDRVAQVLGNGIKELAPSEAKNYGRTNRSIHAVTELSEGTILTTANTALLRTEKVLTPGIMPKHYSSVLGKKLTRRVESGEGITIDDIASL